MKISSSRHYDNMVSKITGLARWKRHFTVSLVRFSVASSARPHPSTVHDGGSFSCAASSICNCVVVIHTLTHAHTYSLFLSLLLRACAEFILESVSGCVAPISESSADIPSSIKNKKCGRWRRVRVVTRVSPDRYDCRVPIELPPSSPCSCGPVDILHDVRRAQPLTWASRYPAESVVDKRSDSWGDKSKLPNAGPRCGDQWYGSSSLLFRSPFHPGKLTGCLVCLCLFVYTYVVISRAPWMVAFA